MPEVMGVLNLTPDSFSDGGLLPPDESLARARRMLEQGADWIDPGAESTRPGASPVPVHVELDRLMPVLSLLAAHKRKRAFKISVDTMKPAVMAAALEAGADLLNDVNGFRAEAAWPVAVQAPGICIVHMQGVPLNMQDAPQYQGEGSAVINVVRDFFCNQLQAGLSYGLDPSKVLVDPGIGFGKDQGHNLELLDALPLLSRLPGFELSFPVLVGLSRKRLIGEITGKALADRDAGSIGGALAAYALGASILRVHDVAGTVDALRVYRRFIDRKV